MSRIPDPPPAKPLQPVAAIARRLLLWGIGLGVAATGGLAIAILRPDWVWRPQLSAILPRAQKYVLSADALFESNSAILRAEGLVVLDRIAAELPVRSRRVVVIAGHADIIPGAVGLAGNPLGRSYAYARAVRDYLMRLRGDDAYYWVALGYGASRAIAPNDSEVNRAANRRVEIEIH